MGAKGKKKQTREYDIATQNYLGGYQMVESHPMFAPLLKRADVIRREGLYSGDGLAMVTSNGRIYCHPKSRAEKEVWAHVLAHCLLHLGMEHFKKKENQICWNMACDLTVEKFLTDLKFGKAHYEHPLIACVADEEKLYARMMADGMKETDGGFGTAGLYQTDMKIVEENIPYYRQRQMSWPEIFAVGLNMAVRSAVNVAAGIQGSLSYDSYASEKSSAVRIKEWFISSYPLLGAIAANFQIIDDPLICQRMDIRIAAVSCSLQEIYINPGAGLTYEETKFVMAHEFLHAALRHDARHQWRDPYFWNVACDYVINGWLTEMEIGVRPEGILYDEQFKGMNAESIYERIVTDLRTYRKLATLRGVGVGDMLPEEEGWWSYEAGMDLDSFYRRALSQGLSYHNEQERGYLPANLVEEIRALSYPPIAWDVELARWFDEFFQPLEKSRSYARPSRRQASTPDIPRPSWYQRQQAYDQRTFGVLLDTSGSMDRSLLAIALGAIASYSMARDVPGVRVMFCDARAYDQGYLKPEDIAGTVKVRGRGGTILQPGIDQLHQAPDFPGEAPILVITDGGCENQLKFYGREHALLVPKGARLPFVPKGKVFYFS